MKTKEICFGVLALVITIGFASFSMDSGQIRALSDTQLVKLRGGKILCDVDCLNSYCNCETHDCEDMECSPCTNLEGTESYKCVGNDGDGADVTACWKTDSESDTCTAGDNVLTNCQNDKYASTDTNCSQSPLDEDVDFYGNDCS